MDWQRKAIIIGEIKYWKDNRLLPEAYCDYLLALYTKGEEEETSSKSSQSMKKNVLTLIFLILNVLVAPGIAFFIIYAQVNLMATISLLFLALVMSLGLSYIAWKLYHIEFNYIILVLLLNLLILSMIVINQWVTHTVIALVMIYLQLIVWIFLGAKLKNKSLLIIGILGMLISMIAFII